MSAESFKPDFRKLEDEIKHLDRLRVSLEHLLEKLQGNSFFDEKDAENVAKELFAVLEQQKTLMCDLQNRQQLYEAEVLPMESVYSKRNEALERISGECDAFDLFPSLQEKFVNRQKNMEQGLRKLVQQISR
jgi:hypothetical protein